MPCGEARIPTDPIEISRLAEMELSRLTHQYHIMENDRVAFAEEYHPKLKVQRYVIDCLEKEKQDLETDLKVATSVRNKARDADVVNEISSLLDKQSELEDKIKNEKAHVTEMDYQIRKLTEQIRKLSKTDLTDRKIEDREILVKKQVSKLETQLDVATKKFDTVLTENNKIREEIDHLIKERAHFNSLWNKMVVNLSKGKKFMMDLVEQATLAYDQRDEWCGKLEALKERGRADLIQHTQEMRELQRALDHDAKLNEYLSVKGQRRIMADLNRHEEEKREKRREEMKQHLEELQRILKEIKTFAKESNVERLAQQFIKQEEENFTLFKYVNELNFELETLNDSVADYHKKIDAQRAINNERAEKQKSRMQELTKALKDADENAKKIQQMLGQTEKTLDKTLAGIDRLFKQVRADNSPILELLGDNATINMFNVSLYLEILERRTIELIEIAYYKGKATKMVGRKRQTMKTFIREPKSDKLRISGINEIVPTQTCPLCVERELVSEVIDTEQTPLSRDQVKEKLEARLKLADASKRLHNVSACKLPESRLILQKRYE